MKFFKVFAASLLACAALVFTSCEKGVTNTGDFSGNLYGVWQLDTKTVDRETVVKDTDFNGEHFYLAILPLVAFAKKGALSALDFKVDVDATFCTYNDVKHQIYFKEAQALSHGLTEVMYLKGTYDVLELSKDKLVISKTVGKKTTTYTYHKLFQQDEIESN
ncbi:MAG: hypothetical protein J6P75_11440 [Bacteroidales bacterium]|nr:hypothetical protein [Bacteroidales bacterium]